MAHLGRGAGNQQVQRLIRTQQALEGPALQRRPRSPQARRHAASDLGAPDARLVLATQLPNVLAHMEPEQLDRIQTAIDATAINPGVRERYQAANAKATKQYGELSVRDEKLGRAADRIWEELVPTDQSDRAIHLDAGPFLRDDLFAPKTDNPDEARYLQGMRAYLQANGLWLLVGDGVNPQVWLSLGPVADGSKTIPAPFGLLTQEALLGTQLLGANFYEKVHVGPVDRGFHAQADHVFNKVQSGRHEHWFRGRIRDDTVFGVVEISDWLGDADWPPDTIWDPPFAALMEAWDHWNAGHTKLAFATLGAAAKLASTAANVLATYASRTEEGAAIAVKWLERVRDTAAIVEASLLVYTGAGAFIAGAEASGGGAAVASELDVLMEQQLERYAARNPFLRTAERVELVPEVGGTGNTVRAGRNVGEGWQKGW